uniref:Uncharacterized protein n=1 Tax=Siphoviridae sp. ctTnV63 TaxID=2825523 RepID=A0A8S5NUY9_9CAUD|nr:MAG TPA: hypothetical protein [Siphoviridae sp. ctTnV63]
MVFFQIYNCLFYYISSPPLSPNKAAFPGRNGFTQLY